LALVVNPVIPPERVYEAGAETPIVVLHFGHPELACVESADERVHPPRLATRPLLLGSVKSARTA